MAVVETRVTQAKQITCVVGSAGVIGGRLVTIESGDTVAGKPTVIYTGAAGEYALGMAEHDAAPGEAVSVSLKGIQWLQAIATFAANVWVMPNSGGTVEQHTTGQRYGRSLAAATQVGQLVPVLVNR